MTPGKTILVVFMAVFVSTAFGCATPDGSSGGWVIVNPPEQPSKPPTPSQQKRPPKHKTDNRGQVKAAQNHIRSAYRFLQKGKPDHALKELEKARPVMGTSYWFHYYMGGAYFFKGMFESAGESWKRAYSYTDDHPLRSRVRTCQSYAAYQLDGVDGSIDLLKGAITLDRNNSQARILLDDLRRPGEGSSERRPDERAGSRGSSGTTKGEHSRYVEEKLGEKGYEGDNSSQRGYEGWGAPDRDDEDDDRYDASKDRKGRGKGDRKQGKSVKDKPKPAKIEDEKGFRLYFLVEMYNGN